MSDDIKKLVDRLRATFFEETVFSLTDVRDAANALEALVTECDLVRSSMRSAVAERDRLKDEVERLRNEKVAGGVAVCGDDDIPAPATDPTSAACEWTRFAAALYSSRCDEDYLRNVPDSGICHRCGKPIKFMEAKE